MVAPSNQVPSSVTDITFDRLSRRKKKRSSIFSLFVFISLFFLLVRSVLFNKQLNSCPVFWCSSSLMDKLGVRLCVWMCRWVSGWLGALCAGCLSTQEENWMRMRIQRSKKKNKIYIYRIQMNLSIQDVIYYVIRWSIDFSFDAIGPVY